MTDDQTREVPLGPGAIPGHSWHGLNAYDCSCPGMALVPVGQDPQSADGWVPDVASGLPASMGVAIGAALPWLERREQHNV